MFKTCIEKEGGDGHVTKMARALAHGEQLSKPFEGQENFRLKGDMWLKLGNMRTYHCLFPGILSLFSVLTYFLEQSAIVPPTLQMMGRSGFVPRASTKLGKMQKIGQISERRSRRSYSL